LHKQSLELSNPFIFPCAEGFNVFGRDKTTYRLGG
jgi:hypothetical protein